jgi:hypothetical protein
VTSLADFGGDFDKIPRKLDEKGNYRPGRVISSTHGNTVCCNDYFPKNLPKNVL